MMDDSCFCLFLVCSTGAAVDVFKIEKKTQMLSKDAIQTVHLHGSGPNTQRQRHGQSNQLSLHSSHPSLIKDQKLIIIIFYFFFPSFL